MAEVTIRIIDNNNGNVDFIIETNPALSANNKEQQTEAQQIAMAFMQHIIKQGINQFIESANDE